MFTYLDDRLGFTDILNDIAYVMDDYGTLIEVPYCIGSWYWQEI